MHPHSSMNSHTNILRITRKQSIQTNEVLFLEAKANYTIIYLVDGKSILAAATLKLFENKLPKTTFCRPNKSFIIHRDFIERVNYQEKSIILKNALIIQASRRKAPLILKMIDPLNNLT
jgi:DNA-binding LytR/AlgR family response regulator